MDIGVVVLTVVVLLGIVASFAAIEYFGSRCPKCKRYRAAKQISSETIQEEGKGHYEMRRTTYQCKDCRHKWTKEETIYPYVYHL